MRSVACVLLALSLPVRAGAVAAQERSMVRDSTLNNLAHPPGYRTAPPGSLGAVRSVGTGPRRMILIPGLGFSGAVFDEFMARRTAEYTMYAVTLPGFGGTAALPMPERQGSYAEAPWTRSAEQAILALMDREGIRRTTLVAHWALATQIALRLALEHPDRFDAVILLAGTAKSYYASTPAMLTWTAEQRARYADGMGQHWFRTVTRQTWDDNNFMSYDYAVNPRRGLFLWREAAAPALSVWIRYLLEFYAVDITPELASLKVPTLVVKPGFDDPAYYVEPDRDYMRNLCHDSWRGTEHATSRLEFATVPGSRLFLMYDQPEALDRVVNGFLTRVGAGNGRTGEWGNGGMEEWENRRPK
jgi:pimeloyl-ACP methyl ester carboxylesterase